MVGFISFLINLFSLKLICNLGQKGVCNEKTVVFVCGVG